MNWITATASGGSECVQVGRDPAGQILIRHSKDQAGPVLAYTQAEFTAFLAGCRDGDFDHLIA